MSDYNKKIKHDLLGLYEYFYSMGDKKSVFNLDITKKLKYKPEEVKKALELEDIVSEKKKKGISLEISAINSREQALKFFHENLEEVFHPGISESETKVILKKVSLEELKRLYYIIFGIPFSHKCKKIDILYKIRDFSEDEKRTDDLIKNLY